MIVEHVDHDPRVASAQRAHAATAGLEGGVRVGVAIDLPVQRDSRDDARRQARVE